jgi:hypothetical protein
MAMMVLSRLLAAGGNGVTRDVKRAAELCKQAAALGDSAAMFQLALMYDQGAGGVAQDKAAAREWMGKSMDAFQQRGAWGHVESMRYLGWIYSDARPNLTKDLPRAAEWYARAAEAGDVESMFQLGSMCAGGQGVPRDEPAAAAWYRSAADLGHPGAMRALADAYRTGKGVARDERAANEWDAKVKSMTAP